MLFRSTCSPNCSQQYPAGTAVTLVATGANGYGFGSWNGDCTVANGATVSGNTCVVTMSQARSVSVTFASLGWTLNVSKPSNGVITSSPAGINCGSAAGQTACSYSLFQSLSTVTLTATGVSGYTVSAWGGTANCSPTSQIGRAHV